MYMEIIKINIEISNSNNNNRDNNNSKGNRIIINNRDNNMDNLIPLVCLIFFSMMDFNKISNNNNNFSSPSNFSFNSEYSHSNIRKINKEHHKNKFRNFRKFKLKIYQF